MSVEQIVQYQWHKIFEDDEIIKGGSLIPDSDQELGYLRHYIFINGTPSGTEKIRTIIYSQAGNNGSIIAISNWSNISDIEGSKTNWQGWIRVDFNREQLKSGVEYYFAIEINGYARNQNTFFISAKFDFDNSVYPNTSDQFTSYPIATEVYTYKEFDE